MSSPRQKKCFRARCSIVRRAGSYRAAVAQVVREVKARQGINDERFAELVGCDKDTIRNAENEETNLNAVTLLGSIAYAFGEEAIEPVRALYLYAPPEEPTIADRCRRIRGELAAIERRRGRQDTDCRRHHRLPARQAGQGQR
jgi:DNA-binding XRE family transcriptional regulator